MSKEHPILFSNDTETNNVFPVITLYQPWATWIMREWKTIETRTHDKFRSLLNKTILIHAGLKTDESAVKNPYLTQEQIMYDPYEVVNGYILGSVYVYSFMELNEFQSKMALIDCGEVKRFGLFLSQVKKFETPIKCQGEMGIWYYDLENKKKVKKGEIGKFF